MTKLKEKLQAQQDHQIDLALRSAVAQAFRRNEQEQLTANKIRKAAQTKLKLSDDFFKEDEKWKARSKKVIEDEWVRTVLYNHIGLR